MNAPQLANDRDRAEWLQCLAAACSIASGEKQPTLTAILELADMLYRELRKRCD